MNCNSLVCSEEVLCKKSGGEGEYYDATNDICLNKNFAPYTTTTKSEVSDAVVTYVTNISESKNSNSSNKEELTQDLLPSSIMNPLKLWTFNLKGGTSQSIVGWAGLSVGISIMCYLYIIGDTERSMEAALFTFIGFIAFNFTSITATTFALKIDEKALDSIDNVNRITNNSSSIAIITTAMFIIYKFRLLEKFEGIFNNHQNLKYICYCLVFVLILSNIVLYFTSKPYGDSSQENYNNCQYMELLLPCGIGDNIYGQLLGFLNFRLPIYAIASIFLYVLMNNKTNVSENTGYKRTIILVVLGIYLVVNGISIILPDIKGDIDDIEKRI